MDEIQAFLQSIGAGTPGNGMPGGGMTHRASTPGAPGLPMVPDQVLPPANSPIPNYKALAPYTGGSWTDAVPGALASVVGRVNPYVAGLMAAAAVASPTSTAADDTISPEMAGQMPQHPPSTGIFPGKSHIGGSPTNPLVDSVQGPLAMPARPYTHTPPVMPARPYTHSPSPVEAAPLPPARPVMPPPVSASPSNGKKRIDPAAVDLGHVPRFTTVQYHVPNSIRNSPIYTALNLGGS